MTEKRITEAEIAELERLCAEATPGPWQTRFVCRLFRHARKDPDLLMMSDVSADWPDAEFIAAARSALPKLLSERREREGKLAELERERRDFAVARDQFDDALRLVEAGNRRAEAAEATLGRVQSWHGQASDNRCGHCLRPWPCETAAVLTTPVVSSDRLTPEERENVEDERAFAAKNNTVPSRSILPLIAIIDRLAPPVSPGETQ